MSRQPGWSQTSEAALNAVLGDYLERSQNPLAIEMRFYHQGRPLALTEPALRAAHPRLSPRIAIFVHGMAQTESCWTFPDAPQRSYGELLRAELGITPFYLRYNTGRHVSRNGRELALLLEELTRAYPQPLEELSLLGHSMGGLLIRSACHYAAELGLAWLEKARRACYLGTPHLGSPYEKAGHLLSVVLGAIDHPVVQLTGTLANLRSAGVKDLRHGSLLDEDWQEQDLDAPFGEWPRRVPLCAGIDHYLVAGALSEQEGHIVSRLIGDALVRLGSATDPGRDAGLPPEHIAVVPGIHHMQLAHSAQVYARLRTWFGQPCLREFEPVPSAIPVPLPHEDGDSHESARYDRLQGYRALLQDAILHGSTAVEQVQASLTRRPYDLLERIPGLETPTRHARTAHLGALRGVYGMIRAVNSLSGVALHEGIERLKKLG